MGPSSVTRHPYAHNTLKEHKYHCGLSFKRFPHIILDPHQNLQPHPPTTDSDIVPHQTAAQKRYLLGIIPSVSLGKTNSIVKANVPKQSSNWCRWCTFLTHSSITYKFFGGFPQEHKTIIVSSFAASVQRNQFFATKKKMLPHGTVKSAILDVSASFWTHLPIDPTLDSSGQTFLISQRQLRGYMSLDPPTKHQKAIPTKLVLHTYKQKNTHLNTSISKLIAGTFFFIVLSCE